MKTFGEYTRTAKEIDDRVPQELYDDLEPPDESPNIGFRLEGVEDFENSCLWRMIVL